ncbi:MAG TPA: PAS domain-containing sensor histidine kinase [Vicinamibacteria bacterium]|nr:PAS domain-containing sensor histidine kinase [Vicinamibacteria bacterium]
MRQALLEELPGLEVEEAGDPEELVRSLEDGRIDLTLLRHPLPAGGDLPVVLKARWPERALLLYGPMRSERALAEVLEAAGDAYFLDSGTALPGLRAALRLALSRVRPGTGAPCDERHRSGEWFATIFDASPVGISLSTLAEGWILDVNERFLELVGYDRKEVLSRTATELGLWVSFPERHIVRMLSEAGRLRRAEVRFRTRSGEVREGLLSVERLRLGDTEAVLSLLDDVTDLRHVRAQRDLLVESERRARADAEVALEQLRQSHERLESLTRRLVELQETERRALARELHDEVGQIVAGLRLQLDGAKDSVSGEVYSLLGQLSSRVRDLSMELRPPMLDEMGLLPTLLWHFERYHAQTGIRVDFHQTAPVGRLPSPVETAAFRIVQEALTNVARHASVQEASVLLDVHPDRIELLVEDRGVGFRPESAWTGASSGLTGMRDRARLAGGRFAIDSAPGAGTRLTAALPRADVEGRPG